MRLRLDLAYDGSDFHGWASQSGLRTVQGEIEAWLGRLLREEVRLTVAGRTDAGVHARRQVAHVDVTRDVSPDDLLYRLRKVLPHDIVMRNVSVAPEGFDARFSAIWRRYSYRVIPQDRAMDPLDRSFVTRVRHDIDFDRLEEAMPLLVGLRDFAPFCKAREGATTIRELRELHAFQDDDGYVEIQLLADAFCHSMVRSLVGALMAVASGKRDIAWLSAVAAMKERSNEVAVMPPQGLVLEEVGYPADEDLAARAREARAMRSLEES